MDLVELLKAIKPLLKLMLELPVPFLLLGLFGVFFYKHWIGKLSIINYQQPCFVICLIDTSHCQMAR